VRILRWYSRVIVTLVATVMAAGAASTANAFEPAGHFYTIYHIATAAPLSSLSEQERRWLAFCAELPDLASDLNAVTVYQEVTTHPIDWLLWAYGDNADPAEVRRMVTVQQLLHSLTGATRAKSNEVGLSTAALLAAAVDGTHDDASICALGLALHLVGDTYAHREISDNDHMYPTGRGHALDLHYPDYVLCDRFQDSAHATHTCVAPSSPCGPPNSGAVSRFCQWAGYPSDIATALSSLQVNGDLISSAMEVPGTRIYAMRQEAQDSNNWLEGRTQAVLASPDNTVYPTFRAFFKDHPSSEPCQTVIDAARSNYGLGLAPLHPAQLDCRLIWDKFVTAEMTALSIKGVPKPSSPFSPGASYLCPITQDLGGGSDSVYCLTPSATRTASGNQAP
jgi:hypothetical protein